MSQRLANQRFFRLQDPDYPGELYYLDADEIVGVGVTMIKGHQCTVFYMANGGMFELTDEDGVKALAWAESLAEQIPELRTIERWRTP